MSEKTLLTIKEAAKLFAVTPLTLRNWDKKGKLKALRHPLNNYRVYERADLEKLVQGMREGATPLYVPRRKKTKKLEIQHLD